MRYHIYYFSATGNTQHSVNIIRDRLSSQGHIVETVRINKKTRPLQEVPDRLLVAFPVLAWMPPVLVQRFVRLLPKGINPDGKKIKAAVLASDAGACLQAPQKLVKLLTKRKYDVFLSGRAGYTENWLQVMSAPDAKKVSELTKNGERMALDFAEKLIKEERSFHRTNILAQIFSKIAGGLFALIGRRALGKTFIADKDCTSCGLCEKTCPVGAIVMNKDKQSRPYWKFSCESCNRCINICPKQAINSSIGRIVVSMCLIIGLSVLGILFTSRYFNPIILKTLAVPVGIIVISILNIAVISFAHWFILAPFDVFVVQYLQKIPVLRKFFELSFTKNFKRYTMDGYKAVIENID